MRSGSYSYDHQGISERSICCLYSVKIHPVSVLIRQGDENIRLICCRPFKNYSPFIYTYYVKPVHPGCNIFKNIFIQITDTDFTDLDIG